MIVGTASVYCRLSRAVKRGSGAEVMGQLRKGVAQPPPAVGGLHLPQHRRGRLCHIRRLFLGPLYLTHYGAIFPFTR